MPEEQDRYELDEMMDRLKGRSDQGAPPQGDLVTREDGSQAIRVRRRKRRSHQPHKERKRRIRIIQVTAGLILLLMVLLMVGFVTIYVNTAAYRKQLALKVEATTGAQAKLLQFRMNPTAANAQGLDLQWPAGGVMDSMELRLLSADVSPVAVLAGKFQGDVMSIQTGKLSLSLPQEGEAQDGKAAQRELPIHFKQYGIKKLQILIELEQAGSFRLNEVEATLVSAADGSGFLLRMTRGDLRSANWPMLRLDRGYIELGAHQVKVVGVGLMHPEDDGGKLELTGMLTPYERDEPSVLDLSADAFLLSGLLGDSLGSLLQGRVDSVDAPKASQLSLAFGSQPHLRLSLDFELSEDEQLRLGKLPVLFALSEILADDWYAEPVFRDAATGTLRREGESIELRDLELKNDKRMVVRGELTQESGNLKGELSLGLPPTTIQSSDNQALDAMFGSPVDGYRWIQFNVSGSAASPADDFAQRYEQALRRLRDPSSPPAGDGPSGRADGRSFEALTRPR